MDILKDTSVPSKTSKKGITIRFSEEEYEDILKKVKYNHFSSINEYIRDCVFNKVTILEDYSSKMDICKAFDECRKEMIHTEEKLNKLLLYSVDSATSRANFEAMIADVKKDRKKLEDLINNSLFKSFIKEKEIRELEENNNRKV